MWRHCNGFNLHEWISGNISQIHFDINYQVVWIDQQMQIFIIRQKMMRWCSFAGTETSSQLHDNSIRAKHDSNKTSPNKSMVQNYARIAKKHTLMTFINIFLSKNPAKLEWKFSGKALAGMWYIASISHPAKTVVRLYPVQYDHSSLCFVLFWIYHIEVSRYRWFNYPRGCFIGIAVSP